MENYDSIKISPMDIFAITAFVIGIGFVESTLYTLLNINMFFHPSAEFPVGLITPLIGIIFGIIGIKSQLKKYSIIAIVLCILPLLLRIIVEIIGALSLSIW